MKITEKIPTLDTSAPGIPSLGLNGYNWWEEASTGVSNNHQTTKFAYPITTGMSFNRTLWQLTGRQIGHEARSLMNAGLAGSTFWYADHAINVYFYIIFSFFGRAQGREGIAPHG